MDALFSRSELKRGLALAVGAVRHADESRTPGGCRLEPHCEGCDGARMHDCYDVRLCTHTVWHSALRDHLY